MRAIKSIIKNITVCLFAVFCVGANFSMVANAAEIDGPSLAIIEVQDYSIEGGMIEAGKGITINLTLHNTSPNVNASSVMVSFSNSTGSLYPAFGKSNQVYVGNMKADGTKEISVPMTIGEAFIGNYIDLTCQFEYVVAGSRLTNSASIVIPTSGGSTIGVKSINVGTHAIVNGKSLLAFSYVNQSSSNITDAKLVVDGNVSATSKEIKLDTVYAGKSYSNDYYLIFNEAGNQAIHIYLQYTDVDGSQKNTDLGTFDVTVSKENTNEVSTNYVNPILVWIGRGLSAIMLVLAVVSTIIYIKNR